MSPRCRSCGAECPGCRTDDLFNRDIRSQARAILGDLRYEALRRRLRAEWMDEVRSVLVPGGPKIECPACGQDVKLYCRHLDTGMARPLRRLYEHARECVRKGLPWDEWMDYRNYNARGEARNHSLLRFEVADREMYPGYTGTPVRMTDGWGLIEQPDSRVLMRDGKLRRAGLWRITRRGIWFVERRLLVVPRSIYHFDDHCYGFTLDDTTFVQALGEPFDLGDLLSDADVFPQPN